MIVYRFFPHIFQDKVHVMVYKVIITYFWLYGFAGIVCATLFFCYTCLCLISAFCCVFVTPNAICHRTPTAICITCARCIISSHYYWLVHKERDVHFIERVQFKILQKWVYTETIYNPSEKQISCFLAY